MNLSDEAIDKINHLQENYADSSVPSDVDGMYKALCQSGTVEKRFQKNEDYRCLFNYWYERFGGDLETTIKAVSQLNECSIFIESLADFPPGILKQMYENHTQENVKYLEAYKSLQCASELLGIPLRVFTYQTDYPISLERLNHTILLPEIPSLRRMLQAVRTNENYLELAEAVVSKKTSSETWAIRTLWKNLNIERHHIIEGHKLLPNRWKLIESLLDCFYKFSFEPQLVRLTLSRNPPDPELINTDESEHTTESFYRYYFD